PRIQVRHINPTDFGRIVRKLRMHGEAFGRMRAGYERWSPLARKMRSASWILLPAWLWIRVAMRVAEVPNYRRAFLRATPLIWIGLVCWSWGEAMGYWSDPPLRSEEPLRLAEHA